MKIKEGCFNLGVLFSEGDRVKDWNYQQAKTYYKKACDMKDAGACGNLGFIYENGKGVHQSYKKAKEYYGKACDLGDQDGCEHYAEINKQGY